MSDQHVQVRQYLQADGYTIEDRPRELAEREVSAWRSQAAGVRQYVNVWMPVIPSGGTLETQERHYRDRFKVAQEHHPTANNVMLVPSREGIRPAFIQEARSKYSVSFRTPVEFFDTTFSWESNKQSATIAKRIRDEGEKVGRERIAQPFTVNSSNDIGQDLVDTLFRRFRDRLQPAGIHIVQGPAGIGKSWLFSSLFTRLYDAFIQDKRERRTLWARPLPLVPEYDPTGRRFNDFLSAFIRAEVDRPMRKEVLDWLVANGHGILMLDGLEEIMALDEEFTEQILEYFTLPGTDGVPTVLICLRDSLMNRNQAVIDFCTEYSDRTTVYNLEKWDDRCIRAFVDRKVPRQDRERFIAKVRSNDVLSDIAGLPYLCDLLVQEFNEGRLTDHLSSANLIENAAKAIITREYDKKIALTEEVMPVDDVLTFAQDLAQKNMEGEFKGVSLGEINEWAKDWAELVWPEAPEDRSRFEQQMSQVAFFEQGGQGRLKFVHEILELYLLGRKYIEYLQHGKTAHFIDAFSHWEFPSNSITLDMLSEYCETEMDTADLENVTFQCLNRPKALKNMLQILGKIGFNCRFLRGSLVKKDLAGLKFWNVNFQNVSFAGCDLDTVEFHACDLRYTEFSGAIISNTGFFSTPSSLMKEANWGDMNTVHSIRVDSRGGIRNIGQPKAAVKWLRDRIKTTSTAPADELPCAAAEQLRHLFGKFIRPDGTVKRKWIGTEAIKRGRKYIQKPREALEAAVGAGYLTYQKWGDRYNRPETSKYAEMVEFFKNLEPSPEIRYLLDEICGNANCAHVRR